ncbi:hypothetical protein HU200_011480 [Digitaria exilis]|uniref:Uncharacterized protein n=1 Tax=Digitaria exilis TaxID=1010633 RepID=A0A835KLB5_9POAL|nr:hypothetical protein HU200_011480 [Digitaria exilis]
MSCLEPLPFPFTLIQPPCLPLPGDVVLTTTESGAKRDGTPCSIRI